MTEFLEGNGYQRLLHLMKRDNPQNVTQFRRAVIVSPPPNVSILLDGTSKPLEDGIILAEHLTNHRRRWRVVNTGQFEDYEIKTNLEQDDVVICADDGQYVYVLDKAVEY